MKKIEKLYNDQVETVGHEKNITIKRFNISSITQKEQSEKPDLSKAKELRFIKGYFLFEDGTCYSEKTNRILSKVRTKGKTPNRYYYSYDLRPFGSCLVPRLVMFVFGKHKYQDIREMPKVLQIDGNPENMHISNLKFTNQSEINKTYNIKPTEKCFGGRGTIAVDNKEIIKNMLKENLTYGKIAKIFNTSDMAVYRFVKKHIKESKS